MSEPFRCCTCLHWQATDRASAYAATCAKESYPGRVAFDMGCDQHSSKPQTEQTVDMQSQARGVLYQMWGVKP